MTDRHRTVRLGYHGSLLIPTRIAAAAEHPDSIELRQYPVTDPFRSLRDGELDIMVVKFRVSEPDLTCSSVLATDARAVVLGSSHPLADRTSLSVEDLAAYDMFRCPDGFPSYVWDEVVPPHTPSGQPLHRRHDLTSTAAMMNLVAHGQAVHLSLLSLADIVPPTVRLIPVHDLPPAPVALAWCSDHDHVGAFVKAAESVLTGSAAPSLAERTS